MRNTLTIIFLMAAGLVTLSVPVSAHHGNAAYDYAKTITLKGTVTEWVWSNPHSFLKFDAKDDKGNVQHWVVEAGGAGYISAQGWSKNSLKPGDEVTVDVMPVKNGGTIGRIRRVTLPDGKVIGNGDRFTL